MCGMALPGRRCRSAREAHPGNVTRLTCSLVDPARCPASHGCVGLYDEAMQKEQYGIPKDPEVDDAKKLFEWVLGGEPEDDRVIPLPNGPRLRIIGKAPKWNRD